MALRRLVKQEAYRLRCSAAPCGAAFFPDVLYATNTGRPAAMLPAKRCLLQRRRRAPQRQNRPL